MRWTRTITVEGPEEWIDKGRMAALADGIHRTGPNGGRIHVETTEVEITRFHYPTTPNKVLKTLHDTDPDGYDAIHGEGMADRPSAEQEPKKNPMTAGGYI